MQFSLSYRLEFQFAVSAGGPRFCRELPENAGGEKTFLAMHSVGLAQFPFGSFRTCSTGRGCHETPPQTD
jgi:hypothetical protein